MDNGLLWTSFNRVNWFSRGILLQFAKYATDGVRRKNPVDFQASTLLQMIKMQKGGHLKNNQQKDLKRPNKFFCFFFFFQNEFIKCAALRLWNFSHCLHFGSVKHCEIQGCHFFGFLHINMMQLFQIWAWKLSSSCNLQQWWMWRTCGKIVEIVIFNTIFSCNN